MSTSEYRYLLTRYFVDEPVHLVKFILLNPSTADQSQDDATVRRLVGFTKLWGYQGFVLVNLFAFRATDPQNLYKAADPVGPENDGHIKMILHLDGPLVCAWGAHGDYMGRDRAVYDIIRDHTPMCFQVTKDGHPHHPLRLPKNTELKPFSFPGAI